MGGTHIKTRVSWVQPYPLSFCNPHSVKFIFIYFCCFILQEYLKPVLQSDNKETVNTARNTLYPVNVSSCSQFCLPTSLYIRCVYIRPLELQKYIK